VSPGLKEIVVDEVPEFSGETEKVEMRARTSIERCHRLVFVWRSLHDGKICEGEYSVWMMLRNEDISDW